MGGFTDFEELVSDAREECHASVEAYLTLQARWLLSLWAHDMPSVDVRRGRLIANAESFVHMLGTAIETLLTQMRADRKAALEASGLDDDDDEEEDLDDSFYPASLPPCILANKEPFKGGDWRKTPYIPRPYVRLTEYDIVEPSMREVILRKLSTKKHGGCSGQHCKSRQDLGLYKHTLRLGEDAEEVDSWGMDCYVRRNIMDAVLESGAFGSWIPPDYKALLAANPVEYAAMRAAASGSGGAATSPVAAALPPPPRAKKQDEDEKADEHEHKEGEESDEDKVLPSTPAAERKESGSEIVDDEKAAAIAAALASPPPTPAQIAVEKRVADWLERGENGWDLLRAVQEVKQLAQKAMEEESLLAAEAVEQRIKDVGYNYFRLHPKGVGLICKQQGGIPPLTFDAVKKITGDELPDFYNIVLERPKDDPDGYDVLFIDAAAKGALASRMSHSCTPNCQAIVMACGGRLTIALYTLREELTFDYSSVTESEKEGSYLYFTGSRAFQQVMNTKHTVMGWAIARLAALSTEIICEYIEEEEAHLKEDLLGHPLGIYNEASATAEAKGVVINRLQNVVITLDKVKMVLQAPNQTDEELQSAVQRHSAELPGALSKMCSLVMQPALDFADARCKLMQLYEQLRALDVENNGGLTAVADLLLLYASTLHWFTCERGYKGVTSPPVPLNLADLALDRTQEQTPAAAAAAVAAAAAAVVDSDKLLGSSNLRKVYRPLYLWGQLSGWFKQTVNDPTASLSAERRGTISLPDVDSSFAGGKTRYTAKASSTLCDRGDLIDQLDKRPDAMWRTGTLWSFRNEAKVYGSPMLDAVWCELSRGTGGGDPLPGVLSELRGAAVPPRLQDAEPGAKAGRGKKK
ncbi:hypothetical protein CHLNCDRAFT_142939 [Chlorella variabilis]|uniref:SET domain-containing protein n=1 Tax=Chlorella variabilis TaxID=554065 RepID=E1Z943_CHLVA|nr:hypothetical protein CHLNCDRAFT_142939 [Chlorella variabilis]EFN57451.1 hypothetical protein CHLNCDRAFT_142939 [Chlorella variabilis]|eukprot:XP_005849553.1 hypothetical protein CHLNCDRAFT_142939 [Chlorella variabilis]